MLWSTVRSTSNAPAARLRRAPFLVPDQPISATVFTSCPTNSLRSLRGTHSSSSTRTGTYHRLDALFQHSHRLLSSHRREVVEKVVQSMPIAGSLQTGDRRVRPRLGLRPGTPLASRDVPGERGRLSSCLWNLGFFSKRCTEKLPLRVDFIHRVEFGEVSGHRVLIKRGPGNRGPTECGTTHEATSGKIGRAHV